MEKLTRYLKETLSGDSSAFNEVISRFQKPALKKAYDKLNDYFLAEDAVQEAFVAAYFNLSSLRNLEYFPAWFRAILFSSCNKIIKKNNLNLPLVELDEAKNITSPVPGPLEALERREVKDVLMKAIASLSTNNREVYTLFYIYDYSQNEIANILNVPVGTVKRRFHDGMEQIRQYFKLKHVTDEVIRVGYMPVSDHLLAMVSHHCNNNVNLKMELRKFLSWSSLTKAIKKGFLDAAFIMAPIAISLKNQGVPIVYVLDAHHDGSAITVRNSNPSLETLASVRFGLPFAVSTHYVLLHYFLHGHTISPRHDISARFLSPSYIIRAFRQDQIDGFFCAEPWNTKSVFERIGRILVRSKDIVPGHICCIVVVSEDFVTKHGDIVQLYLKQLNSAKELIWKHPELCARILARYTGINHEIAEDVISKRCVTFDDLVPDRGRMEECMKMSVSAGVLEKKCKLDNFISLDFI